MIVGSNNITKNNKRIAENTFFFIYSDAFDNVSVPLYFTCSIESLGC